MGKFDKLALERTDMDLTDPNVDIPIRAALRHADCEGKLAIVSMVVGLSERELRTIMTSADEISVMQRAYLLPNLRWVKQLNYTPTPWRQCQECKLKFKIPDVLPYRFGGIVTYWLCGGCKEPVHERYRETLNKRH